MPIILLPGLLTIIARATGKIPLPHRTSLDKER